jgi:uncharacterized membrane protein YdfJ with MMPL/SSD domain
VARGTTGAPRNVPGQDTRNAPAPGFGDPGAERDGRINRSQPRSGRSRLIAFVCGRRSKYLVVVFWVLVVAALGGLAGKLQGAEKNASQDSGLSVYVGGPAASAADQIKIFNGIDTTLLYATLAVVIVLLLLTYRSPVLWLLPILSAGVALTVAQAMIYLLTQHANLTVNGQSEGILVVLVIGASTDYALLLIARYREELRRHADRHQAMAVALRRAGPAIIASGLTVVAGVLCLLAAESNDISGLGPVAAIGIAVGLIAMITLLPALLVVFGRWVFWPVKPNYGSAEPTRRGVWSRIGQAIGRRPRTVWMVTAILLGIGAISGLAATGGVITSAGLVLAGNFAMLSTLPLVEFTEIGFAVHWASCSTRSSSARCS